MQARVTKAFKGRPDGEVLARDIAVGEEIGGELAQVAVAENWAVVIDRAKEAQIVAAREDVAECQAALRKAEAKLAGAAEADKAAAEKDVADAKRDLGKAEAALAKLTK